MVISSVNTVTYNGDGITTAWPYTFPVTDDSEIRVQLNNADGTAVIVESDYYVDLINSTVYYPGYAPGSEPPEAEQPPKVQTGQTITVYREIPITQESDLGEKWPFEVIEKGLDKLTMIAQQIDSDTTRTLDNALASMELLADTVVDSAKLQDITEQLNDIENNTAAAEEAASEAKGSATSAAGSLTTVNSLVNALTTMYNDAIDQGTLTAPALDSTLTIQGAAADAAAVGENALLAKGTISASEDINNYKAAGMYLVSNATIAASLSNWPTGANGTLTVTNHDGNNTSVTNGVTQCVFSAGYMYWRRWGGSVWSDWEQIPNMDETFTAHGAIAGSTDIDNVTTAGMYYVTTSTIAASLTNWPTENAGHLNVYHYMNNSDSIAYGQGIMQTVFSNGYMYWRRYVSSAWTDWAQLANDEDLQMVMDDMPKTKRLTERWEFGLYRSASIETTHQWITSETMFNMPYDITLTIASTGRMCIAYYDGNGDFESYAFSTFGVTISANTNFRVSLQYYPAATITDFDDVVDLLEITTWDMASTNNLISNVNQMVSAAIEGGTFNPQMESGTVSPAGVLQDSTTRLRTVNGNMFPVQAGDTIALSDYTTYKMYIRGYTISQSALITSGSWFTTDYTIPLEGRYYILVERVDGTDMTRDDVEALVVTVTTKGIGSKQSSGTSSSLGFTTMSMFPTIGVCGDSWASGSLHHPDGSGWTGNYDISWPQDLGRMIGATVTNFTHGGRSVKTWLSDAEYGLAALLAADPLNLYILNFGINDNTQINAGTLTVGTIADCLDDYTQNPDTFYGDYGKIIGNIQAHAPNAVIIIMSVARVAERANMDPRIQEVATHFELPYIYLPDDPFFTSDFFLNGIYGKHPLSYTYGGMAKAIERLICANIENHPEYYETYYGTTDTGTPDE